MAIRPLNSGRIPLYVSESAIPFEPDGFFSSLGRGDFFLSETPTSFLNKLRNTLHYKICFGPQSRIGFFFLLFRHSAFHSMTCAFFVLTSVLPTTSFLLCYLFRSFQSNKSILYRADAVHNSFSPCRPWCASIPTISYYFLCF